MILIGEAGGTKTDWRLLDGAKISQYHTGGYNPIHQSGLPFRMQLKESDIDIERVKKVHFYAAGVKTLEQKQRIRNELEAIFQNARAYVESDVLAAGRALLGGEAGWVGFLGTGSGLAYYDGETISKQVPSLGYILGDEGSGSYLGKRVIRDYLRGHIPTKIKQALEQVLGDEDNVIRKVYVEKGSAQYLGGVSKIINNHLSDQYVHELVNGNFNDFFDAFLPKDYEGPLAFTGSIAFVFSNVLRKVAMERNIAISRIIQSPIAGLTLFHQENGH